MHTFEETKRVLIECCENPQNKVVLLRGGWGTGKTFMWDRVKGNPCFSRDNRGPAYVSLFGVRSIQALKLKAVQNLWMRDAAVLRKLFDTVTAGGRGFFQKFTGASFDEAAEVWIPSVLRQRYIVLDDIERRHKSLDLDELAGMIDEFTQTYECRFLLLMNETKIDKHIWAALHEKIVNAEILLAPSVEDVIEVAIVSAVTPIYQSFSDTMKSLRINNIRGMRRVWNVVDLIRRTINADGVACSQWVPNAALMVAVHYRLHDDMPTMEFLRDYSFLQNRLSDKQGAVSEQERKWQSQLESIGYQLTTEFEYCVAEYLDTGFLATERLVRIFSTYRQQNEDQRAFAKFNAFHDAYWWDSKKDLDELLRMALDATENLPNLDLGRMNDFVALVKTLTSDPIDETIVDRWFQIKSADPRLEDEIRGFDPSVPYRMTNQYVSKKILEYKHSITSHLDLRSVIEYIRDKPLTPEVEIFFSSTTQYDYVDFLINASASELMLAVEMHLGWCGTTGLANGLHHAGVQFVIASSLLCESGGRLADILRREYSAKGLSHLLNESERFREGVLGLKNEER